MVFTANQGMRGGRAIELKKTVDAALAKCPCVQHVFIYKRTENPFNVGSNGVVIDEAVPTTNPLY